MTRLEYWILAVALVATGIGGATFGYVWAAAP